MFNNNQMPDELESITEIQ